MSFAAPYLLLSLLVLPVAAIVYAMLDRRRATRAASWSRPAMLPNVVRRPRRRHGYLPKILLLLALASLLVGFARPQRVLGTTNPEAPTIVLAFDTSGSMAADDVAPTRLRAARRIALDVLRELPSRYRVAVVTFAGGVHLAVAPTLDRKAAIAGMPTSVTRLGGTALGDGIAYSVALAAGETGESSPGAVVRPGAVLLFTDGAQTSAGTTPAQAAVSAVVDYIPVDAVAIGTRKGVVTQPVEVAGVHTMRTISVPVKTSALRTISRQTNGVFFDASSVRSPTRLAKVYENLRPFSTASRMTQSLSPLTAAAALVFLVAGMTLSGVWFGRIA